MDIDTASPPVSPSVVAAILITQEQQSHFRYFAQSRSGGFLQVVVLHAGVLQSIK
jgi:hypothetical protein